MGQFGNHIKYATQEVNQVVNKAKHNLEQQREQCAETLNSITKSLSYFQSQEDNYLHTYELQCEHARESQTHNLTETYKNLLSTSARADIHSECKMAINKEITPPIEHHMEEIITTAQHSIQNIELVQQDCIKILTT